MLGDIGGLFFFFLGGLVWFGLLVCGGGGCVSGYWWMRALKVPGLEGQKQCLSLVVLTRFSACAQLGCVCICDLVYLTQVSLHDYFILRLLVVCCGTRFAWLTAMGAATMHVSFGMGRRG